MPAGSEQVVIKVFELQPVLRRNARSAQADDIEATDSIVSTRNGKGRQVFANGRSSLHQRQLAHSDELVHETISGDKSAILDVNMASQQSAIGDDHVVAKVAIVTDMAVGHEKIVGTDFGFFGKFIGAVHGDTFAKHVSITNPESCGGSIVLQILRCIPDDTARVKNILFADVGFPREMDMRTYFAMGADRDVGVDDGKRTHLNGCVHVGLWMQDGGWMNHRAGG